MQIHIKSRAQSSSSGGTLSFFFFLPKKQQQHGKSIYAKFCTSSQFAISNSISSKMRSEVESSVFKKFPENQFMFLQHYGKQVYSTAQWIVCSNRMRRCRRHHPGFSSHVLCRLKRIPIATQAVVESRPPHCCCHHHKRAFFMPKPL